MNCRIVTQNPHKRGRNHHHHQQDFKMVRLHLIMCTERGRGGMREVRSDRCTPEKHPDPQPDNVVSSLFYDRWFLMVPHKLSTSRLPLGTDPRGS